MNYEIYCQSYGSAFSFCGTAVCSKRSIREKAKQIVRQSGELGHTGYKGVRIKIVSNSETIEFNPR